MTCRLPGRAAGLAQFYSSNDGSKSAHRLNRYGRWEKWEYSNAVTDAFEGRRISILGDSISTYEGYVPSGPGYRWYYNGQNCGVGSVEETWWMRLIEQTGMSLCANNSISGSYCASVIQNATLTGCSDVRIQGLAAKDGTSPDVIVIFMGMNDYHSRTLKGNWNSDVNVGDADDTTFSGAYAVMVSKIKTAYPAAKIYCCTLPYTSAYSEEPRLFDYNGFSVSRAEWNDVIRRVASYYECEIIEFEHCGINVENCPFYSGDDSVDDDGISGEGTSGRGMHPNARGHELLYLEAVKHFMSGK